MQILTICINTPGNQKQKISKIADAAPNADTVSVIGSVRLIGRKIRNLSLQQQTFIDSFIY